MTPRPPSSAAFVLLAMNYIQVRSCQRRFYAQFKPSSSPGIQLSVHPTPIFSQAGQVPLHHPSREERLSARYARTETTQSYCLSVALR